MNVREHTRALFSQCGHRNSLDTMDLKIYLVKSANRDGMKEKIENLKLKNYIEITTSISPSINNCTSLLC